VYTTKFFSGSSAWMSVMLTIAPSVLRKCGAAACARKSGALTLVPIRLCHTSSVISPTGVARKVDALLISASSRP
jgi:hypothetical protein